MSVKFEWDDTKAAVNLEKHDVSFDEAKSVFRDSRSLTIFDVKHSDLEERYIDIGMSARGRILVVVYTEKDESIRIISCRKATIREQRQYER